MLVSIIIPVYNVAPYVEQCIQSVINQTYKNLEVIIVDDCGTDNSMEMVEKVVSQIPQNSQMTFKILHHEHNRGLSAARNTGIKAATGQYLYFLDSDDWIIPECIELMVGCVEKHPDTQIVFAGAEATSKGYEWLDYTNKRLPEYSNDIDWLQLSMLKRYDFGMTAWNKLVSREFVLRNMLYFEEGIIHEDEVWNFDIAKYISCASFLQYNTYIYNLREGSITKKRTEIERLDRLFLIWNIMVKRINGQSRQLQAEALSSFITEKTCGCFPANRKKELCMLFIKIGIATRNHLSFLFFAQALITMLLPHYYANTKILLRITLYR